MYFAISRVLDLETEDCLLFRWNATFRLFRLPKQNLEYAILGLLYLLSSRRKAGSTLKSQGCLHLKLVMPHNRSLDRTTPDG